LRVINVKRRWGLGLLFLVLLDLGLLLLLCRQFKNTNKML
jgi:hypothetical protein